MVEALRSRWHGEMPFEAMIRLGDDLDEMPQRSGANVRFVSVIQCPECGHVGDKSAASRGYTSHDPVWKPFWHRRTRRNTRGREAGWSDKR